MLPTILIDCLCSLKEKENKLCYILDIYFDNTNHIIKHDFKIAKVYKFINGDNMNKLKTLVISLVLIVSSGVASAISVSGNMSLTSDYIWRGMTQNDGEVAIQGGFDLETDSGFYLGTWAGSANFGGGESLELDYYGGYAGYIGDIG